MIKPTMVEKHIKDYNIEVVMQRPVAQDVRQVFFSEKNYTILETTLLQDYSERYQLSLDDKERKRLTNTVQHYCGEVYKNKETNPFNN